MCGLWLSNGCCFESGKVIRKSVTTNEQCCLRVP